MPKIISRRRELLLAILWVGCSIQGTYLLGQIISRNTLENAIAKFEKEIADVPEIDVYRLKKVTETDRNAITLIDVREARERNISLIPGAITLAEFESQPAKHSRKVVVVYCTVGYRSAKVARRLRQHGIKAYNLHGGIVGWTQIGGELVDASGNPTKRVHTYGRAWNFVPQSYIAVW